MVQAQSNELVHGEEGDEIWGFARRQLVSPKRDVEERAWEKREGGKEGIRSKSPVRGYLINANAWLAMPTVVRDLELVHHVRV